MAPVTRGANVETPPEGAEDATPTTPTDLEILEHVVWNILARTDNAILVVCKENNITMFRELISSSIDPEKLEYTEKGKIRSMMSGDIGAIKTLRKYV
jgi:hypothetical protein